NDIALIKQSFSYIGLANERFDEEIEVVTAFFHLYLNSFNVMLFIYLRQWLLMSSFNCFNKLFGCHGRQFRILKILKVSCYNYFLPVFYCGEVLKCIFEIRKSFII